MKNPLIKNAKDTVKLGIFSMGGMGVMGAMKGAMGNMPGVDAAAKAGMNNTSNIVGSGLQLANIGQLAKTGMSLTDQLRPKKKHGGK